MKGLVLAPMFNSGGDHPSDATSVFQPGAEAFAHRHGLPAPVLFDNHIKPIVARLPGTLRMIAHAAGPLDALALFSHGWFDGAQWGASSAHVEEIAEAISGAASIEIVVALYACSTGEDYKERGRKGLHLDAPGAGDGCFADLLRDHLLALGKRPYIVAHACAGHAFQNPYVRVFDASTTRGGEWLISPNHPKFHVWDIALHHSSLWARMPFMTREAILAELG